jgi:hypothetical protein
MIFDETPKKAAVLQAKNWPFFMKRLVVWENVCNFAVG